MVTGAVVFFLACFLFSRGAPLLPLVCFYLKNNKKEYPLDEKKDTTMSEPEEIKPPVGPRPVLKPKRKPSRGPRTTAAQMIAGSAAVHAPDAANTEFADGVSRNGTVRGFPGAKPPSFPEDS